MCPASLICTVVAPLRHVSAGPILDPSGIVCFSGQGSVFSLVKLTFVTYQGHKNLLFNDHPSTVSEVGQRWRLAMEGRNARDLSVVAGAEGVDTCATGGWHSAEGPFYGRQGEDCEPEDSCPLETTMDFPPVFLKFLQQNQLDPCIYRAAHTLPRYVRLRANWHGNIASIEDELETKLSPVAWLPGFFCISAEKRLAGTEAYKQGKIFGMDVASGAAVIALEIDYGDDVLDLCAAPGAKLCMMAELLGNSGTLTAVDISEPRLAACRTMLQKYEVGNKCRLFLGDGTLFSLLPIRSRSASSQAPVPTGWDSRDIGTDRVREWTSRKTKRQKRASKRAKLLQNPGGPQLFFYGKESGVIGMSMSAILGLTYEHKSQEPAFGYDKVLVDAECTHDGSFKHILKYDEWGWGTFERRFLNEDRLSSITELQLKLLTNGFRLLKPNGTLVYSTCSLTEAQNEGVVRRFLSTHPLAELRAIDLSRRWPCKSGMLPHTLRFDPLTSNTSGLFIAKIVKKAPTVTSGEIAV